MTDWRDEVISIHDRVIKRVTFETWEALAI
jgi:hypothetical protein